MKWPCLGFISVVSDFIFNLALHEDAKRVSVLQLLLKVGWVGLQLDTPLLFNADVSLHYISDMSTDNQGGNLDVQQFSVPFFSSSIYLLSSPGNAKFLIICTFRML